MTNLCSGALLGLSHVLTNAPYFVLIAALFWRERRFSPKATIASLGLLLLIHGLSSYLLMRFFGPGEWSYIQFSLFCLASVLLPFALFQISFSKALYSFLLIRAIYITITYIVLNGFMLAYPDSYIGFDATPWYLTAVLLATGLVFPLLWRYFTGSLQAAFHELDGRTIKQMCVPPILFFILDQCYSSIRSTLEHESAQTAAIFLLILIVGLATYYVNLKTLLDAALRTRRESELQIQLALQAKSYENLTDSIEAARAARHDLRHHMSVIRDFSERGDEGGLIKYLDEYIAGLPLDDVPDWCQNRPVNALLKHYLSMADGVRMDIRLNLPQNAAIPDSDLSVVFGNIFENAVKSAMSCPGGSFIRARCETSDRDVVLLVENSLGEGHQGEGLGLKNVESIARKHGGTARFEIINGTYRSSIILMKPLPK
ncbi:GHKL domain-containing protein [Clostridiaceae bacterium OttesenSCG-928-D20]|nr:GHKL domain-containing protein [Clostridiaceae bacterium OttesenSCG-928-D20]